MKSKVIIPTDMVAGTKYNTDSCGVLIVVEYRGAFDVDAQFEETKTNVTTNAANIRQGKVRDRFKPNIFGVGFVGVGEFKSSKKGKTEKAYATWNAMMRRCYDESTRWYNPTYAGCSVCIEWHNFQNFAKWFYDNYPQDGKSYDLDKDIKNAGNKIYSPENCMFVTRSENVIFSATKAHKFISPEGEVVEIVNLSDFCKNNGLDRSTMYSVKAGRIINHKGWTKYVG